MNLTQREFVADDYGRVTYPFRNLLGGRFRILDPFVIEVGATEVRLNCIALDEDDAFHVVAFYNVSEARASARATQADPIQRF